MSVVWKDSASASKGGELVCWGDDDVPLEVAPLAMVELIIDKVGDIGTSL